MIKIIIKKKIIPIQQEGKTTIFKRRTPKMSQINNINSIVNLYDHIRMLDAEGYPKAYIETEFFKFEFTKASIKSEKIILSNVRIIKK